MSVVDLQGRPVGPRQMVIKVQLCLSCFSSPENAEPVKMVLAAHKYEGGFLLDVTLVAPSACAYSELHTGLPESEGMDA